MSRTQEHETAEQIERKKVKLARRERKGRIWNIVLLAIAILFVVTVLAIQASHHL